MKSAEEWYAETIDDEWPKKYTDLVPEWKEIWDAKLEAIREEMRQECERAAIQAFNDAKRENPVFDVGRAILNAGKPKLRKAQLYQYEGNIGVCRESRPIPEKFCPLKRSEVCDESGKTLDLPSLGGDGPVFLKEAMDG